MVSTSIPLLRAGGQCRKVILTPAGRYRYTPCCTTVGHVSNIRDRNYGRWMEEKLTELRGVVRNYVHMRNIKRATVIEMGQLLTPSAGQSDYLHEEEIWGDDPVHLTTKGYGMVAAELESLIYEKRGEERKLRRRRARVLPRSPGTTLQRADPPGLRAAWLRLSGEEGVGGSQGRPSNTHGGAATRSEEGEEGPTSGKDPAETVGNTTAMDPDSRVTGAATGGGATEALEARTGAAAGPGERPTVETLFFVLSLS
jgi:hypothetical protein